MFNTQFNGETTSKEGFERAEKAIIKYYKKGSFYQFILFFGNLALFWITLWMAKEGYRPFALESITVFLALLFYLPISMVVLNNWNSYYKKAKVENGRLIIE